MMNDYWHIPRASLTSSAASSSAASSASSSNRSNRSANLNPATVHTVSKNFAFENRERNNRRGVTTTTNTSRASNGHASSKHSPPLIHQTIHEKSSKINSTSEGGGGKRGSSSSQGSSKSNNSTRSAASGSLLLTAANLERFAEIHKKQEKVVQQQLHLQKQNKYYLNGEQRNRTPVSSPGTNYNSNLVQALANGHIYDPAQGMEIACISQTRKPTTIQSQIRNDDEDNNSDAIITMDPNLDFIKTKNLDSISIASSMHFTMVNGEGGPAKKAKRGLCDRGRQVTVLIISMSTIFLLLIMGMVYALEMRAREMPQS